MQPEAAGTEEWMVEESAKAGFNVYSPRIGFDDLAAVRQVTEWCQKYGIYHMPWMRGSLTSSDGPASDGKRMVWANGVEQPLWSPNADEFWAWTEQYIVEYAKMGAENRHIMGVFLIYENYAPAEPPTSTTCSYDDIYPREIPPMPRGLNCPNSNSARARHGSTNKASTKPSKSSKSNTGASGAGACASWSTNTTPRFSSASIPRPARRSCSGPPTPNGPPQKHP